MHYDLLSRRHGSCSALGFIAVMSMPWKCCHQGWLSHQPAYSATADHLHFHCCSRILRSLGEESEFLFLCSTVFPTKPSFSLLTGAFVLPLFVQMLNLKSSQVEAVGTPQSPQQSPFSSISRTLSEAGELLLFSSSLF